ncbi:MAG TPA: hypothetical protein PLW26_00905 [Candidatus Mcinerneyibacteriales bacterium]|nr:hypothetical protein [Candidatus Mcinerneyibacteriales bacterium]
MKRLLFTVILISAAFFSLSAQESEGIFAAEDVKYDSGGSVDLSWNLPGLEESQTLEIYRVLHGEEGKIIQSNDLSGRFTDRNLNYKESYSYVLRVVNEDGTIAKEIPAGPVLPGAAWFSMKRAIVLVALIIIFYLIIHYIRASRRGIEFPIRKIPALESVDEAIGRATEMGKPILFVPGIMDIDDVQTVAGIIILGEVASKTAAYDATLNVPVSRSMVMSTARETVKESYLKAGRPDAFNENMIHYLTDDQFGYVSGVDGIMAREKPAAIFMLGTFYAESLILAETGNSIGAIQIAGTAMPSQLPFFIAACDYTLIGEELYAASAYLSGQPHMLGALKGQDMAKLFIMIILIVGTVLTLLSPTLGAWIINVFSNIG